MSLYRYKARDKYGSLFTGTIETIGKDAVAAQLDSLGFIPVIIKEESPWAFEKVLSKFQSISLQDKIIFSRQLSTLINAGIPFISSLDALCEQTENKRLKEIIHQLRSDVEGGSSFSEALEKHPDIFNELYVNMVRAGEIGGVLDEILERLAKLAEHEMETRARIKTATRYPKIVVFALIAAFIALVTLVVPKFAAIYAGFDVQLPLPTRILIGINNIVRNYWHISIVVIALVVYGTKRYIKTEQGRLQWDRLKLKIPVFGTLFLKISLSRFTRLFGTLIRSGLPILETLEITSTSAGNVVISRIINNIRDSVREGKGLVEPMKVSKTFPPIVVQMIAIGEESGKMEEMLTKVSEYYDRDVEYAIKNLSTSIEPILLFCVGIMVLFLALAIFMPWWNLISVFKGGG
ncbi:MAG: type II secretion system F family protein [Nitrospirota bacterium]